MLTHLSLHDVGPVPEMTLALQPRLNLITGDNGLGKSFLLDLAWWSLTQTWPWPPHGAVPDRREDSVPRIVWSEQWGGVAPVEFESLYDFPSQKWVSETPIGTHREPPLVIYARVDGGFSVFDPRRRGEMSGRPGTWDWAPSNVFQLDDRQVLEGLTLGGDGEEPTRRVCDGLWRDLSLWALDPRDDAFDQLQRVVTVLTPHERVALTRKRALVVVDDTRESPILETRAGRVLLVQASSALRRILSLAYILVWTWREHRRTAQAQRVAPCTELVLLIDEVEAHLHPRWQRCILPAVMQVAATLSPSLRCQLLVTTYASLVLASIETRFDARQDGWFDLDLDGTPPRPTLHRREFERRGDAESWLDAFDLLNARGADAERAIDTARVLMKLQPEAPGAEVAQVGAMLKQTLGQLDPFWVPWRAYLEARIG